MNRVRLFSGMRSIDVIDPGDRGLAYGDGLFETMRIDHGSLPWWPRHRARLAAGAQRLGIAMPEPGWLDNEVASIIEGVGQGVLKLVLTRGSGGRGYLPADDVEPTLLLSLHPLPAAMPAGLAVHWSGVGLAAQPALGGIKHLNRLEQVLARRQAAAAGVDDGLMLDPRGFVVCASSANLAARVEGRWLTPPITHCGVAGVCRGWLLEHGLLAEARLRPAQVEAAEAVFLCNAVRGILPVARLGRREYAPSPAIGSIIGQLCRAEPAFARQPEAQ